MPPKAAVLVAKDSLDVGLVVPIPTLSVLVAR